jgi:LysM repeat protein
VRFLPAAAAAVTAIAAIAVPAVGASQSYTVVPGDNVWTLSQRFGTSVDKLIQLNELSNADSIAIGQVLLVPTGAPPAAPAAPAGYVVQSGDTLWSIARRTGISVAALSSLNGLSNANMLQIGQTLTVPVTPATNPVSVAPAAAPASTYAVQAGDTLWGIASRHGTPVASLASMNALVETNLLQIGQVLRLPPGSASPAPTPVASPAPAAAPLPAEALVARLLSEPSSATLMSFFDRWADANNLPRELLKGLCYLESGWNNGAVSPVGAIGIGQLLPDTATFVNKALLGDKKLDPQVPEDNIRLSARYLRYLLDLTGNENTAIAAYYQGLGSIRRIGLYTDTVQYVQNVQALRRYFV